MRSKNVASGSASDPGVCGALSAGLGVARLADGESWVGDDSTLAGRLREPVSSVNSFILDRRTGGGVIGPRSGAVIDALSASC